MKTYTKASPLPRASRFALALLAAMSAADLGAAVVFKADNQTFMNDAGSWAGGSLPTASDIIAWDSQVTATNAAAGFMGGSFAVSGVSIRDPQGTVQILADGTLTIGTGGIDMSTSTQDLFVGMFASLANKPQTWNVGGRTLTVDTFTRGAGSLIDIQTTGGGAVHFNNGTASASLPTYYSLNRKDYAALNATNDVVVATYTDYAAGGTLSATYTGILNVTDTTAGATQAWRQGNSFTVGSGVRFGVDNTRNTKWTVDTSSSGRLLSTPSILVGSAVTQNIEFNGSGNVRSGTSGADILLRNFGSGSLIFNTSINNTSVASGVVKGGSGKLVYNVAMAYTGNTKILEGTLQVGNGATAGSLSTTGSVQNDGALVLSRSDAVAFPNVISGSGSVSQAGSGELTLSGANTYTGATNADAGLIVFSSLGNLGGGTVINLNGGGLKWSANTTTDISTRTVNLTAGVSTLNTNGNNVTLANPIGNGGAGGLAKAGTGSLTLSAANSYSGNTTVNAGKLIVANTSGSATSTGAVAVGGVGTLAGTGSIAGTVSVATGGVIEPGNAGVGTLTLGGLSLASGSILDFEFASPSSYDKVVTTGTNTLTVNGGGFRLYNAGTTTGFASAGTYNLVQFSGAIQGTGPSALSVLNQQAGFSYTFGSSGGFLTLQILQDAILSQWNTTTGGSWATGSNWSNGVPSSNYTAQFTSTLGAPSTVTLDGDRTINGLVFNSSPGYTIASGSSVPTSALTLQKTGGAAVNTLAGDHVISAPVVFASDVSVTNLTGTSLTISGVVSGAGNLTKDGPGLLSLTASNPLFSGNINVLNGVLGFSSANSLGTGSVTLNGATLLYNAGNTADISGKTITFGLNGAAIDTNGNNVSFANGIGNSGVGFFSKSGLGTLTLNADSTYQGQTFVKGGVLAIAGNGSLGPVASAQALNLDGGLVAPLVTMTLDNAGANARPIVVGAAGGGFQVADTLTLTVPGQITGTGQLSKSGLGSLVLPKDNSTFTGGLLLSAGSVTMGGNDRAMGQSSVGTGTITFGDGAKLFMNGVGVADNGSGFGTLTNAIVVPAGVTAELRSPARGGYSGVVTGSGTFNLYVDATRFDVNGAWPAFAGTLQVNKTPTGAGTDTDDYRMSAAQNMPLAKVQINSGVSVYQTFNPPSSGNLTTVHTFGELTAPEGVTLGGNPVGGRFTNYTVGGLNTDFTISGQFRGTLLGNFGLGYPSLTKVGTGTLTLNNNHMMTGAVTVSAGTLKLLGSIERFYTLAGTDGVIGRNPTTSLCDDTISLNLPTTLYEETQPGAFTVATGATLAGNGALGGAVTINGILRPDSTGTLGGNLRLTNAASLTLASTATTQFDIKGAVFTGVKSTATGAITYGGNVVFNFPGTIFNGDYKVFDLAVPATGTFAGVTATSAVTTTPVTLDGTSGNYVGTIDGASLSFNPSTGVLTVSGSSAGSAVTPSAPALSATAGNAKANLSWTSPASIGEETYTVKRATVAGGPYTDLASAVGNKSYSDTTVTNGTTYYYVVQAKNVASGLSGAVSNEVSVTPTLVVYTALQNWRFEQFGVYDDTAGVLAGDNEDYDGDGLVNILEYALGTDPKVPNASPVVVAKSGNFLTLTYPRRSPADASLAYAVEGSATLTGGFTATTGATTNVGSTYTYTDDVNLSTAGTRRFLRLSVTYTAPAP